MSPPRNYPIPNQYISRLITEKDPSLPPHLAKYPPGYKSLLNDAYYQNSKEDDRNDYIYTWNNYNEGSINNFKVTNNKDNDDK